MTDLTALIREKAVARRENEGFFCLSAFSFFPSLCFCLPLFPSLSPSFPPSSSILLPPSFFLLFSLHRISVGFVLLIALYFFFFAFGFVSSRGAYPGSAFVCFSRKTGRTGFFCRLFHSSTLHRSSRPTDLCTFILNCKVTRDLGVIRTRRLSQEKRRKKIFPIH